MHPPQQYTGSPMPLTPQPALPPPPYIARPSYTLMSPFQSPMVPVRSAQPSAFATPKNGLGGPRLRHVQQAPYGYPAMISDNNPSYANVQQSFFRNPSPRLAQAWHIRKLRIERQQAAKMKVDKLKRQLKDLTREYIEACEGYAHALENANAAHELISWTEQTEHLESTAAQPI